MDNFETVSKDAALILRSHFSFVLRDDCFAIPQDEEKWRREGWAA